MEIKLFDSELKIMEILWREGGARLRKWRNGRGYRGLEQDDDVHSD